MKILLILLLIFSCSSEQQTGKTEAEILYKEAISLKEDGQYTLSNQKLNQIKSHYPYSYYATKAELMSADIYFLQDNYIEAASSYLIFKDMHPKNQKLDYVYLKIAESFFMQRPSTFDRDLGPCHQAIRYYDEFMFKFPNSKHIAKAKVNKSECFAMIKNKEKYIADFYYRTKVYDAAIYRYKNILQVFQDKSLKEHSMKKIIKSYSNLKKKSECNQYFNKYRPLLSKQSVDELSGVCLK